jgi:PmbA protein
MKIEETILELTLKKADSAEVIYEEGETKSVNFENNKLKYAHSKSIRGVGLRIIKDGRIGFSSTTDLRTPQELVEKALHSAQFGQGARFSFPSNGNFPEIKIFDEKVVDFPMEKGISWGREIIDMALAAYSDCLTSIEIGKTLWRRRLLNSQGLDVSNTSTTFGLSTEILQVKERGLIWIGEAEASRKISDTFLKPVKKILERMKLAQKEVKINSGTLPVIFTPKAMGLLLSTFEMGCNGKLVQKGISPFLGKLGEKIVDSRITLYDDPTIDFAPGSYPLDGEGIGSQRTPLFENGVLKNFLFDLQTAGIMSTRSTGNGLRSFASQPAPACTNLILKTGDTKTEDMIRDIPYGLLVDQVLGGGQSNTLAGEFSVNIDLGFLIEKGQLVGRVKDCMIAGNVFDAFNNIAAIGDKAEWYGMDYLPSLYFKGLSVVGKEE